MSITPPSTESSSAQGSRKDTARPPAWPALARVRPRTYIIGLLAVVGVCWLVAYGELVASRGGSIDAILLGATHMPPGAIGVLIVLLLANALMKKVAGPLKLNSAELSVIYFMLVCAALILLYKRPPPHSLHKAPTLVTRYSKASLTNNQRNSCRVS